MLADQQFLRIPGPTPIPPSVQRAMNQTMIGHRGQEAKDLIQNIRPRLKPIFGTGQDVMVIAGSGTAGLETAVVNVAQPNDEVLVVVTGSFGDRFTKICEAYQLQTHIINVPWGEAVQPEQIEAYLKQHPSIKVVFTTFCETSTGVLNPIKEIASVVHQLSEALLVVDGVSCIGGVESRMDEWGVDVLITGSQKALMLPAGLTFVAASERAWKVIKENPRPRFYLNLSSYQNKLQEDSTPFTPALSLLFGLDQVLNLIEEEGFSEVVKRHELMKNMTRSACKALGVPLLTSDETASPTVTAIKPGDFDSEQFRKTVKQEFGLTLAGGQQQLKGKIFRIGHMGYTSPSDVLQTISLLEMGLYRIGKEVELGKGVAAAQAVYLNQ
ncbi:pyridoxal-phosphate-dependent aminotransferase family protein [Salinibacillus xinjiangensis]|uniref:Aminotransferase class V-fold PLP-dependent enzyme n=1 Tax=Salinibacillus xinjiangensis TaxID=1229268 RepID=A0A6G1X786_9BACI|nr:alanine--glyoxylate aminotransferase family protein [Salinibacillus xinjiangensis]MRG86807.1 aminotransferase class V-fold PLP-dependent enzyme [Salinibacillus xinjiangensis]